MQFVSRLFYVVICCKFVYYFISNLITMTKIIAALVAKFRLANPLLFAIIAAVLTSVKVLLMSGAIAMTPVLDTLLDGVLFLLALLVSTPVSKFLIKGYGRGLGVIAFLFCVTQLGAQTLSFVQSNGQPITLSYSKVARAENSTVLHDTRIYTTSGTYYTSSATFDSVALATSGKMFGVTRLTTWKKYLFTPDAIASLTRTTTGSKAIVKVGSVVYTTTSDYDSLVTAVAAIGSVVNNSAQINGYFGSMPTVFQQGMVGYSEYIRRGSWSANNGTTFPSVYGLTPVYYGDTSSVTMTPSGGTGNLSNAKRMRFTSSNTPYDFSGIKFPYDQVCQNSSYGDGGYTCTIQFGYSYVYNTTRIWAGLVGSVPNTSINPSQLTDFVGIFSDSSDTNLMIMCNNNEGEATKYDTGIGKNASVMKLIKVVISSFPQASGSWSIFVKMYVGGNQIGQTTLVNNCPGPSVAMAPVFGVSSLHNGQPAYFEPVSIELVTRP
jgi:hypothetical protein